MKQYKLVGEDKHSFTVHDGNAPFRIAKSAIEPHLHKSIRGYPKYAEGGEVDAPELTAEPVQEDPAAVAPVAQETQAPLISFSILVS